jgi:hypothetical protein
MAIFKSKNCRVSLAEFYDRVDLKPSDPRYLTHKNFAVDIDGVQEYLVLSRDQELELDRVDDLQEPVYLCEYRSHMGWEISGFLHISVDMHRFIKLLRNGCSGLKQMQRAMEKVGS